MVIPVLLRHQHRHSEAGGRHGGCHGRPCRRTARQAPGNPRIQGQHGKPYPYREGIERPGVRVVPLPHLVRRLVEIDHDGYPGHEEHEESHPRPSLVPCELEEDADDAEQQGQHVIMVLRPVVTEICRGIALVPEPCLVDEPYPALPVACEQFAGSRAVYVVLPPCKVPHEISPVHPVELIVEEELEIGAESRLLVGLSRDGLPLAIHIDLIELLIPAIRAGRPHPREEHLALG